MQFMDSASPQEPRRISPSGEKPIKQENPMDQPLVPKDERNISANNSPDAVIIGPHSDVSEHEQSTYASGNISIVPPLNTYPSHEQMMPYGGYGHNAGYSPYLNAADGLHVSPVIYNDNASVMYQGYGFNQEMPYGQYSHVATPMGSMMLDGSGYLVPFGSFGGGDPSGISISSPLTSPAAYPQTMGILGPYEYHYGQVSQQSPSHVYGLTSAYQHGGPHQRSTYGSIPGGNDRVQLTLEKGRRREKDQDSVYSNDSLGFDRNKGPRASKNKGKSSSEHSSSGNYNCQDLVTDYKSAKFFVIKSFSEDNVHKSIKYSVWSSTPHGNKKLEAAYQEANEMEGSCPIFLFFSVNASGQFCGVAEMVGRVDFEKDADYWQQDRWSGQFPVKWLIIKDVPNSRFRHILLENNDNKPVTHSRDSQEVKLDQGIEMLKIFKDHDAQTSILEDFNFYDQRERTLLDRRTKQQPSPKTDLPVETVNQISQNFSQALHFDDGSKETSSDSNIVVSLGEDSSNHGVSPGYKLKKDGNSVLGGGLRG